MKMVRPEWSLLLRCARALPETDEGDGPADAVRDGLDWDAVLRLSVRHRVVPLVYQRLARGPSSGIPGEFLGRMRALHLENLTRNMSAARLLAGVMGRLEGAGIRAAAYKGPVLAVSAYGSLGSRMFNDLDVFIDRDEVPRALRLLAGLGFEREGRPTGPLPSLALRLLRDVVLRDERGRTALEIQWRLCQPYHPAFRDQEAVWDRTARVTVEGAPLRTFSPEDTLLLLCLHGLYHAWSNLQMVADVSECLGSMRLNPALALRLASENRMERILFLGLLLAEGLLSAAVPAPMIAAAREDRFSVSLAEKTGRLFFVEGAPALRARRYFFKEAMMFSGLGARARYFGGRLLTPNEEDLGGRNPTWPRLVLLPARRLMRLCRAYAPRSPI
jgi:hypothetical protein